MSTTPTPTLFALVPERVAELRWEAFPGAHGVDHKMLYCYGEVTAGMLRFQPHARELRHVHADGEHHLWVVSGEIEADETALPAGSYLHVPSHLLHTVADTGQGSVVFYVYTPVTA